MLLPTLLATYRQRRNGSSTFRSQTEHVPWQYAGCRQSKCEWASVRLRSLKVAEVHFILYCAFHT